MIPDPRGLAPEGYKGWRRTLREPMTIRPVRLLCSTLSWSLALAVSRAPGQDLTPRPDVPGSYTVARCIDLPLPAQLPPLDSVLDSATVATELRLAGVSKPVLFGLRIGALATTPSVRVLDAKVPASLADTARRIIEAALRPIPADRQWAFRLRVEGSEPRFQLERSRLCAGSPPLRDVRSGVATVTADQLAQMRREIEDNKRKRGAMRHRVFADALGRVVTVELVRTSGDAQMDANEAETLQRRRFAPTKLDGLPVAAWIEVPGDYGFPTR